MNKFNLLCMLIIFPPYSGFVCLTAHINPYEGKNLFIQIYLRCNVHPLQKDNLHMNRIFIFLSPFHHI